MGTKAEQLATKFEQTAKEFESKIKALNDKEWKANTPGPVGKSETGQIRVTAPAGNYELRLWLEGGRMEGVGRLVSAAIRADFLLLPSITVQGAQRVSVRSNISLIATR